MSKKKVLLILSRATGEGTTVNEVAEILGIHRSNVNVLFLKMVDEGLLDKFENGHVHGGIQYKYKITKKGVLKLEEAIQ